MSPSRVPEGESRGHIVPIGGAENKENDPKILARFVQVSGGDDCRHRRDPDREPRARDRRTLREDLPRPRREARRRHGLRHAPRLPGSGPPRAHQEATGIFFTGGNQLRLTTLLGGTPVAKLIRAQNASGVTVGGTSAGASILSEHMIAYGDDGATAIAGSVRLAPGLGLTNRFIIDQHFRERDRLGRLITALAYNPFAVGPRPRRGHGRLHRPGRDARGRGHGRRHRRRRLESEFLLGRQRDRGPADLHPRAGRARADRGRELQPAHAAGLGHRAGPAPRIASFGD